MTRATRLFRLLPACFLLGAALAASGAQINFELSRFAEGQLPPGFASLVTGRGAPGDWKIVEEKVAPALAPLMTNALLTNSFTAKHSVIAQTSEEPLAGHSPLLLYTNELLANCTVTTRFKIISGTIAPEAGIVFRAQDENNYYVVRASTDGNVLWYRVVGGVPYEDKGIGVKVPIACGAWYELSVQCSGNQIRCLLNGRLIIPPAKEGAPTDGLAINDSTFGTGKAGLWTDADTVAYFADTRIDYTPRVPLIQTVVAGLAQKYSRLLGLKVYALNTAAVPVVIADGKAEDLGSSGGKTEAGVIKDGTIMYLKQKDSVELTMPLRDRNGDITAAVKITMPSFKGETTDTAATRATLIKNALEAQLDSAQDINQ